MTKMKVLEIPHPVLREKAKPVEAVNARIQSLLERFDLDVARDNVTREVKLFSVCMRVCNAFGKIVQILETVFTSSQRERRLACIDSVCSIGKRILHSDEVSRRS